MSVWNANSPLEPLTGSGCIECPDGHTFGPDDALGALETLSKNLFTIPDRAMRGPNFGLSEMEMKEAQTNRIGGDDHAIRYNVHFPNLHEAAMYDPTGAESVTNRVKNAVNNGGPEALASTVFEMSSLFCNPPRGATPQMGKDVAPIQSHAVPLEIGPYCVSQFQNFDHVSRVFTAVQEAVPAALRNIANYQKIRDFISGNHHLASAVDGETRPQFNKYFFKDRPNSSGSITWFANAIDYITSFAEGQNEFKVKMSSRLFSYWMKEYAKANNVTLNADFSMLNGQVGDYIFSANGPRAVKMISQTRNIEYTIEFDCTPIYVNSNKVGDDKFEWGFQPYYESRAGDDTRSGEAAGFVQDMNPLYGAPTGNDPLHEMILIYNGESHCYEKFPTNPMSQIAELESVNTSVRDIVDSMRIKWFFGTDAQVHFLDPLFKIADKACPSNIDNTWFAGRAWTAFRTRWLTPRACGALLVQVPSDDLVNEEMANSLNEPERDAITLSEREPTALNRDCIDEPAAADPVPGELRPECDMTVTQGDEDQTIQVVVERRNGVEGALSATYAAADGTAVETTDWVLADGTLNFVEGQDINFIEVTIKGGAAVNPADAASKQFTIAWGGGDLGADACTTTTITILDNTDEAVAPV